MDIFESEWLISMLTKSSKTPQGRLLSLFDILNDWLKAPKISPTEIELKHTANHTLVTFCTMQAKACGAEFPEMLAEHIVLIARNAAQQVINQPDSDGLLHAKKVANALIQAQTQNHWSVSALMTRGASPAKGFAYGIAASLFLIVIAAGIWLPELLHNDRQTIAVAKTANHAAGTASTVAAAQGLTANDAARMYTKYEQIRNGTCQYPEALQIPDKDKTIYLENVVGGKLPTNLEDLAIATSYLEKVRCNFTPMLMARST